MSQETIIKIITNELGVAPHQVETTVTLLEIDEFALLKAIEEFNDLKRAKFLKKYESRMDQLKPLLSKNDKSAKFC